MRAWFYPGDNFGQEFAYPKMKSIEIARVTKTVVPTILVETEVVDEVVLKTAPVVIVDETGSEKALVIVAQNSPVAEPERVAVADSPQEIAAAPQTLPSTASSLPLIGLVGLASLGAFGLLACLPKRKVELTVAK